MIKIETVGFVGVGVMGEPICRNLAQKCGHPVLAADLDPAPLQRLAAVGVATAPDVATIVARAELIFLSLPGGPEVEAVATALLDGIRPGQIVVDTSTAPVALTRDLAERFAEAGAEYADAPVARTRAAAETGTLSVMVGAPEPLFGRLRPYLDCFASEVTHCGAVGAGQVVKLMNNMVVFQTTIALAEALTVGRRAGVAGERLFETLALGSADSFVLRNHGMKALLPGVFPERAFSARYALKDLAYALELAGDVGIELQGAALARELLVETIERGHGAQYHPVVLTTIDPEVDG